MKSKIKFGYLFYIFVTNVTLEPFVYMIMINVFMKSKIEFGYYLFNVFVTNFTIIPFIYMIMFKMFIKSQIKFGYLFNVFVTNVTLKPFIFMTNIICHKCHNYNFYIHDLDY